MNRSGSGSCTQPERDGGNSSIEQEPGRPGSPAPKALESGRIHQPKNATERLPRTPPQVEATIPTRRKTNQHCESKTPQAETWLKATNERQDYGAGILHQEAQFPIDQVYLIYKAPIPLSAHAREQRKGKRNVSQS